MDDSFVTISCPHLTTIEDDERLGDVTAPGPAAAADVIPPDLSDYDDDESLPSSKIAAAVKSYNVDYDADVVTWQRQRYC